MPSLIISSLTASGNISVTMEPRPARYASRLKLNNMTTSHP